MYAQLDLTKPFPQQVIGWHEGETLAQQAVNPDNLIALTQEQWDARLSTPYIDGTVIVPAPPTPLSIPTLSMRQARLALLNMTLLDDVEAAITTTEHRIWWDYSTTVERSNPLVISVLTALGKTSAEIDEMFITATLI